MGERPCRYAGRAFRKTLIKALELKGVAKSPTVGSATGVTVMVGEGDVKKKCGRESAAGRLPGQSVDSTTVNRIPMAAKALMSTRGMNTDGIHAAA